MKPQILVSGSVAYDQIMDFAGRFKDNILPEKIHILNVSFFIEQLKESFGGTAGNIAYNLALLGERPTILANVGSDFSSYRRWLQKNKIDISQIKVSKNEKTPVAYIITDQDDNQIAGFYPGAMAKSYELRTKDLEQKFKVQGSKSNVAIAIVSPQNPVDMIKLPEIFKKKKIPYIFDPGQQITSLNGGQLRGAIPGSKVLIGNDYEINLISKKTGWSNGDLLKKTEILVTTLGEKGSVIKTGKLVYRIPPAKPKNTSDPTGAGDAYRAGLIYGLLRGWPLEKVGRLAGLVAVYTVEKYGTQTHKFTWKSLAKRYRQNFGERL